MIEEREKSIEPVSLLLFPPPSRRKKLLSFFFLHAAALAQVDFLRSVWNDAEEFFIVKDAKDKLEVRNIKHCMGFCWKGFECIDR